MNILHFLTPKNEVAFLYDDYSLRQALEKMEYHQYSASAGAVRINTSIEDLVVSAMSQNFVPVVDDRNMFIGIVKRKEIIRYCYQLAFPGRTIDETGIHPVDPERRSIPMMGAH